MDAFLTFSLLILPLNNVMVSLVLLFSRSIRNMDLALLWVTMTCLLGLFVWVVTLSLQSTLETPELSILCMVGLLSYLMLWTILFTVVRTDDTRDSLLTPDAKS